MGKVKKELHIPDTASLCRYLGPRHVSKNKTKILHTAFLLRKENPPKRPEPENYVSINWIGYQDYKPSKEQTPLRDCVGYAQFIAGEIREIADPVFKADVIHCPSQAVPSHSGLLVYDLIETIKGRCDDEDYLQFLASIADRTTYHPF